ncbi:Heterogeneous nuclear ribonucleoprotein Q [Fukomys damarensis]|uniref:Heterogeneous nuclear ribonucleoprotein Q n=1 Tax=Fukomys damarensis TaxID=885580 RepID=A0A091D4L1_FUKDA|nr:Heterogeneous nuclear ribonucleoprotein Q [Fukomys damarensis]
MASSDYDTEKSSIQRITKKTVTELGLVSPNNKDIVMVIDLEPGIKGSVRHSTRAGHREQRARVSRNTIPSDRIPPPQPNREISGNMATEHVNGNGTEEPMDTTSAVIHSENFQTLLDAGLPQKVAEKLDEIYVAGLVAHSDLDERAIEALKEFNEDGALAVLQQFKDSDLSHVQNKSAFLCGVMKTYRQREKQGTKVADSSKGPDEAKIKALLERTGYTLDVTTGQRKYGGPPPDSVYSGQQPSVGTEIFVGKIPRDLFEDELVPLFEKAGPIWDLRLMMDPLTGLNRGYAFVTFCTKEAAQEAVKLYNNHEIRSGKHIGVCISVANNRLFVGSIPKSKTKEQILEEFSKVTEGLTDVILYHQPDDKKKNRGFCFLEYEDHKTAAQARRRLMSGKVKVWGNVGTVEWADPIEDPDPEVMAKVKVLFVRNLANTVTEEILEKAFSQFGKLERVKKLKDYAFIHFDERDGAVKAMEEMNGKDLEGENIEIVFAKPPDQKRKERKAQRQAAKNQMYDDYYYYGPPHMPPPTRGRGRGGRGGYGYPPDYYGYEDYYDYYGYDYHNYRGGYEDPYYGYEDFQVGARGRGGRGARGAAPSRGRGAAPPRGRAGYSQRGGPGSARGVRGARGGAQQQRGRGQGKGVEAGPDLLQ